MQAIFAVSWCYMDFYHAVYIKVIQNKLIAFCALLFILMVLQEYTKANDISLQREELLMQDIPMVITPSRVSQPILESPSAVIVITKKDIMRYGMTSLADILRNVTGVDVMTVSPTDRNISIRGLNSLASGRILTLIDGQPVYADFYGMTAWGHVGVEIDEIEQIEIMKGPGSALYGANAFDGVINIITIKPEVQSHITRFRTSVDQNGRLDGHIIHGNKLGKMYYRAFAGFDKISGWENEDAGENGKLSGLLRYDINNESSAILSGYIHKYNGDIVIFSGANPANHEGTTSDISFEYVRSKLKWKASWRALYNEAKPKNISSNQYKDPDTGENFQPSASTTEIPPYNIDSGLFGTELQHSLSPLDNHLITWGLNYNLSNIDSELLDGPHTQSTVAGYIQDQMRLARGLNLTAGLRYDWHPLTGNNISPRASVVYSPAINHALRISAGKAFRNPPSMYSYLDTECTSYRQPIPVPLIINLVGNKELSPEEILSFELGYQGMIDTRIRGSVDLFYNNIYGLIDGGYVDTYKKDALYPGSPGGIIPSLVTMENVHDANARGVEIAGDFAVTPWLTAYMGYSYQHVTEMETGKKIESAPVHKSNHGVSFEPWRNLMFSVYGNYISETSWDGYEVPGYSIINSAVNYRVGKFSVNLSVSNLLNKQHIEHPQGEMIGRSMILSLAYEL